MLLAGDPWPEWQQTDVLLAKARRAVESARCPCGCGLDSEVAHDAEMAARFYVTATTCHARQALADWQKDHEDEQGALLAVTVLPEGVTARDARREAGRAEYAALRSRFTR